MQWLIYAICLGIGFLMGVLTTFGAHRERKTNTKKLGMFVTPRSVHINNGYEAYADKYRLEDDEPFIRVNRKWYSVYEFKNSYAILLTADPDYAHDHLNKILMLNLTQIKR